MTEESGQLPPLQLHTALLKQDSFSPSPPTPGAAAGAVAEAALAITAEKPRRGSAHLALNGSKRRHGRITLMDLDDRVPEIRPRAPTKLGKKMQAARTSFHHERIKQSKDQGGNLQWLYAQSANKPHLGGAGPFDLLPRSGSDTPTLASAKVDEVFPLHSSPGLSLSMLPTATDQWQIDKTLYYSPMSCTSSMVPHKFPATLRAGMLLYYTPMQREYTLESVSHAAAAKDDEQAAAGAESFRASLQDAARRPGPSARALELFKLAEDPEALLAAEDRLNVWVAHLARKAGVHPDALWDLLEKGSGVEGQAHQEGDGSSPQHQAQQGQPHQGSSNVGDLLSQRQTRRSRHNHSQSHSKLLLKGALRRDPVANFNGYITTSASGYVTGLQTKSHSKGQAVIVEGLDTAQHLHSTRDGTRIEDTEMSAMPRRGPSAYKSHDSIMEQVFESVEDVYRVGPRQRTARRRAQANSPPQDQRDSLPGPHDAQRDSGVSSEASAGSAVQGAGLASSSRQDHRHHLTFAGPGPPNGSSPLSKASPDPAGGPLQAGPHCRQQHGHLHGLEQHQHQQHGHRRPHPYRLFKSLDAFKSPHTLLYKTFLDADSQGLGASMPPQLADVGHKHSKSVASLPHNSLSHTMPAPFQMQPPSHKPIHHANTAAAAVPAAQRASASSAGIDAGHGEGGSAAVAAQASQGHALLAHPNKALHLPTAGMALAQATVPAAGVVGAAEREVMASRESLGYQGLDPTTPPLPESHGNVTSGAAPSTHKHQTGVSCSQPAQSCMDSLGTAAQSRVASKSGRPLFTVCQSPQRAQSGKRLGHNGPAASAYLQGAQSPPPPPSPPTNFQALRHGLQARTLAHQKQKAEAEQGRADLSPSSQPQLGQQQCNLQPQPPIPVSIDASSPLAVSYPEEGDLSSSDAVAIGSQYAQAFSDSGTGTTAARTTQASGAFDIDQWEQEYTKARASVGACKGSSPGIATSKKLAVPHGVEEVQPTVSPPSAVDTQLDKLKAVAESRGSGRGPSVYGADVGRVSQKGGPQGGQGTAVAENDGQPKASGQDGGKGGTVSRGHSSSSRRPSGPKILDHKLRPLRATKPAAPLLVLSSGLADSYKMITQVNDARQVKHRLLSAEKQLTPLALKRMQRSGIS